MNNSNNTQTPISLSFLCFFLLVSVFSNRVIGSGLTKRLFVFGDSYVDTGNIRKSVSAAWRPPYGVTFPGKPFGRFSDGRVSTDFLARSMGIKRSPIPYIWRRLGGKRYLKYGMNFAYGGTGVFDTLVPQPNMSAQIDSFQQLLHDAVFTAADLSYSVALVSAAGNDYSAYLATNGSLQGFEGFIPNVISQLTSNLKRINELGVKKILIAALQPLGCLPDLTVESAFRQCNETANLLVNFHNTLLQESVAKLNGETKESTFVILNLYEAFSTFLDNNGSRTGDWKFENPLKPCCVGVSREYACGNVDANGQNKYTVCDNPNAAFFWDDVHPSQQGWRAVYSVLQHTLNQI